MAEKQDLLAELAMSVGVDFEPFREEGHFKTPERIEGLSV